MVKIKIEYSNPCSQLIQIEMCFRPQKADTKIQFARWRPGRYEIADFAQNIQEVVCSSSYSRPTPESYLINNKENEDVTLTFSYWAGKMDAGNSWLDESQLYLNYINFIPEISGLENSPHHVTLQLPEEYKTACSLPQEIPHKLIAKNYAELIDSPSISSTTITSSQYVIKGTTFHIVINGEHNLNMDQVIDDFTKFTEAQVNLFGEFPSKDFYFLIQALPYRHYHGVEHQNSTVITLGPGKDLQDKYYNDLLGVASHELFHCWNVTRMRPDELSPFDFSTRAIHNTGYITEGLTTYYGDLFLVRSTVFNKEQYFKELETLLNRYYHNNAHHISTLTNASIDLWLNGYKANAPHNHVSIYVKGALCALVLDLLILKETNGKQRLDDFTQELWRKSFLSNSGYNHTLFQDILKNYITNPNTFIKDLIEGTVDVFSYLKPLFEDLDLEVSTQPNPLPFTATTGVLIKGETISSIDPNAPAYHTMMIGDEIISVNDNKVEAYAPQDIGAEDLTIKIKRQGQEKQIVVTCDLEQSFYPNFKLISNSDNHKLNHWLS